MEILWQEFRYGARMLVKQPGFTLVALFTLALGIGANTVIFSVINGVLLKPLPYDTPERLVMLWEHKPPNAASRGFEREFVSPPNLADWQAQQHSFSNLTFWSGDSEFNMVNSDGSEKIRCSYVASSLFQTVGVQAFKGRVLLPEEDQREGNRSAVIGYDLWQRHFSGTENIIGQTVTLDTYGRRTYTVVGVMPPDFQFPGKTEIWLPAGWNGLSPDRRAGHWLSVLGRLKEGVDMEQAQSEMNLIQSRIEQQFPQHNLGSRVVIVPLLEQTVGRNLQKALWVLWGAIAAVLLIACANVANLLLARATGRQKEIVIRLALGASRWQVVRQLLTENLLLALAGGIAGWLLAWWGLALLIATSAAQVPRLQTVKLDGWALGFTLLLSLLTSLLCGLAPALQTTRPDLNQGLKESSKSATASTFRNRLRSGLIVAEIALSLMLLVGAGLMLNSFLRLVTINRGFQTDHLLVAKLDFSVSGFTTWVRPTTTRPQVTLKELMQRLQSHPGVKSVAAINGLPRSAVPPRYGVFLEQGQPSEVPRSDFMGVTPDYFRTLGVPLLQGRAFTERDVFDAPAVAIINESFAKRFFHTVNPVGKLLAMEGRTPGKPAEPAPWETSVWKEIVGVVADTRRLDMNGGAFPEVYVPYWQWPMQSPDLLIRTEAGTNNLAAVVGEEVKALSKGIPTPNVITMNDLLADVVTEPRLYTALLSLFGVIALLLSAVGVYSVISYLATQRNHEFGIRVALGATRSDVLRLVIGQGLRLTLTGIGLGLVGAFVLSRVVKSLLFQVDATDPLTFGLTSLLLVGAALLACWFPARKATKVDPMITLRYE